MKTISIGRKNYQVATNWSELKKEQYLSLIACPRLNSLEYRTLDNEAAACLAWLGMSRNVWNALVLSPWQWGQLRREFAWLFETKPVGKPPISCFIHKGQHYHLPNDGFSDTSAIEVAMANMAYVAFANPDDPDPQAIDRLIATLCRPRRPDWRKFQRSREWNGDVREEYTEQRMMDAAKRLADLDMTTKLVVLDYFERMNAQFLANYGELFGGGQHQEPRYGNGLGWVMLLKNVAKEGHFGDFDKVCSTPAHLLFATLLDDVLDQQDQAEKNRNPSTHENY